MKKKGQSILLFLLFSFSAGSPGYIFGKFVKPRLKDGEVSAMILPISLLSVWLAIVWHELGHVIGGWLAGFTLHLFAAGPLHVERVGGRLQWGFNRSVGMWAAWRRACRGARLPGCERSC